MSKFFKIAKRFPFLALSVFLLVADLPGAPVNEFVGFLKVDGVHYDQPLHILGSADLSHVKAQEVTLYGPLEAHDLKISGNLSVLGPVKAEDLQADEASFTGALTGAEMTFRKLTVDGLLEVSRLRVQELTQAKGSVNIRQSKLQKLEVVSEEVILEDVELGEIHFKKSDQAQEAPKLILKGKTIVQQGISFDSGDGQVVIEGSQVVIKGKVEGALPFGGAKKSSL